MVLQKVYISIYCDICLTNIQSSKNETYNLQTYNLQKMKLDFLLLLCYKKDIKSIIKYII